MASSQEPRRMTVTEFADKIKKTERLVIVCGAGLSYGAAPLAQDVENGLLTAITRLANEEPTADLNSAFEAAIEIREPYLTLELFVSGLRHRVPDLELPLLSLYRDLFQLQPTRTHLSIAAGIAKLKNVVILTSNFDDGLTKGLRTANVSYSLITDANVASANSAHAVQQNAGPAVEVCAYHGTVDDVRTDPIDPTPPTSMAARDLAHPFAPEMSSYISRVLSETTANESGLVMFVGHRGEDFYDLNLEIRNAIAGGKSNAEREERQKRFVCVPHLGDLSSVSQFYEDALTKSGFIVLTDGGTEWLADLFDAISGKATPSIASTAIKAPEVERRLLMRVDAAHPVNSPRRKEIAKQCKSLLIDIESGVLAAWSIVEHYRLESLGYPQDVIASFARPKSSTKFFGIPIIDFISLQREYQSFRDRFEALEKVRSAEDALVDGLSLSLRLERLGVKARNVLASPISNMHKSLAAVLAAIAYDYAGLIAMRCMRAKPHPSASDPSLDRALAQVLADIEGSSFVAGQEIRADRLFLASAGLAERAGLELDAAANQDEGDPTRREEYKQSLSQIVGWQDWALAPAENRLRLDRVPFDEKLSKFEELISKRMVRISLELAQPLGRKSFSAAGDAAQCAQRLGEVLRLVCGVRESGAPDRQKFAKGVAVDRIVDAAIKYSVECLTAGNETSSIPNFRFLSAYDALVLAALYRANDSDARDWIAKAREYVSRYAGDDKAFRGRLSNRLRQVESRLT